MLAGEPVLSLEQQTQVPKQSLHRREHQAQIDSHLTDGVNSLESAGLWTAHKRIKTLDRCLRVVKDASDFCDSLIALPPKRRQAVEAGLVTRVAAVPPSTFVWRSTPGPPGKRGSNHEGLKSGVTPLAKGTACLKRQN
jgi:hypothetical protein